MRVRKGVYYHLKYMYWIMILGVTECYHATSQLKESRTHYCSALARSDDIIECKTQTYIYTFLNSPRILYSHNASDSLTYQTNNKHILSLFKRESGQNK